MCLTHQYICKGQSNTRPRAGLASKGDFLYSGARKTQADYFILECVGTATSAQVLGHNYSLILIHI